MHGSINITSLRSTNNLNSQDDVSLFLVRISNLSFHLGHFPFKLLLPAFPLKIPYAFLDSLSTAVPSFVPAAIALGMSKGKSLLFSLII